MTRTLYVVSDLHIGGNYPTQENAFNLSTDSAQQGRSRGFRMCTRAEDLAAFVRAIGVHSRSSRVELVINGDFLDFLAEEADTGSDERGWIPFIANAAQAAKVFRQIVSRDMCLFEALKDHLKMGHALTFLLGNHDVELSLPSVRMELENVLDSSGRNLRFIYDGEAYSVGSLLIEHGNRYDPWNVVNHDGLRRLRSAQTRHESSHDGFCAPAGSHLVASVMNPIKQKYPFVDLLKPENEAVLPILLALAPEYKRHIFQVASLGAAAHGRRAAWSLAPVTRGDMGNMEVPTDGLSILERELTQVLSEDEFRVFSREVFGSERTDHFIDGDASAVETISGGFGWMRLLTASAERPIAERLQALAVALRAVNRTFDFDPERETERYLQPAQRLISSGYQVVIFGHTHMAKRIQLANGVYINTGTWANLIELPKSVLASSPDSGALLRFVEDMKTSQLDGYLRFKPTFARVRLNEGNAVESADLLEWHGASSL